MTTSNSQPCPRCGGTGKNPDNSMLGWPGKPCYICLGTGKRIPLYQPMRLLIITADHYERIIPVADTAWAHQQAMDSRVAVLDRAHAAINKWADARFEAAKQPPAIRTAKPADEYEKGYDHGWDDAVRIASERWYKGDRADG